MQGILIVDKPQGWTSFDVIAKLRGMLATRKLGHSGTLDPMATGVLPVFVGQSAKAVDLQLDHTKAYRATIKFGLRTDTGDITGQVLETSEKIVAPEELQQVLPSFLGEQMQVPPMYSAVKINGVPLYKAAREGKTVERKPRAVTFHSIKYLQQVAENEYEIEVACSKGTYIRVLAEDIGQSLGCVATLSALRRIRAGLWGEENAVTMETLQQLRDIQGIAAIEALLLDTETVFTPLPMIEVKQEAFRRLLSGAPTYRFPAADGRYRVRFEGKFVGLAQVQEGTLLVEKLFCERG